MALGDFLNGSKAAIEGANGSRADVVALGIPNLAGTALEAAGTADAPLHVRSATAGTPTMAPLFPGGTPGNPSLKVDGSGTPVVFSAGPTSGQVWACHKLILTYDGSAAYDPAKFGGEATGLGTGLSLVLGGVDIGSVVPIKYNGDPSIVGAVTATQVQGSAFHATHTWDFDEMFGGPLVLEFGDVVSITVSEDLTTLSGTSNLYALLFATVES